MVTRGNHRVDDRRAPWLKGLVGWWGPLALAFRVESTCGRTRGPCANDGLPDARAVCETLSTSTEALDRGRKRRVYGREGIEYLWFINPTVKTLEVHRLDGETYRVIATHSGDDLVRAEPFDAIELPLGRLWER